MNQPNWADIIQTVGIVGALLFAGLEFRARRSELRFRNYLDAISGFVDLARQMVERQKLHLLYHYSDVDVKKAYENLTPGEKALVHYCDTIIALCETVWLADTNRWLPKGEWEYWLHWVHELNGSPYFRWTLRWVENDYDKDFLKSLHVS